MGCHIGNGWLVAKVSMMREPGQEKLGGMQESDREKYGHGEDEGRGGGGGRKGEGREGEVKKMQQQKWHFRTKWMRPEKSTYKRIEGSYLDASRREQMGRSGSINRFRRAASRGRAPASVCGCQWENRSVWCVCVRSDEGCNL